MSEHSPFSRDILARARLERTPARAARERVFNAVLASGVLSGAATAVAAPSLLGKLASVAGKWWLLGGACLALGVGGARLAVQAAAPRPATVAVAPSAAMPVVVEASPPTSVPLAHDLPTPAKAGAPGPTPVRSNSAARLEAHGPQLEQELSLLHAAHDAYSGGRSEQALALLAQHRSRFPRSQLSHERATLEALALCRLGRGEANCAPPK